jgi:hypothetical protein
MPDGEGLARRTSAAPLLNPKTQCEPALAGQRPRDKCLARPVQSSPAEQIRDREGRVPLPLAGHEDECSQDCLRSRRASTSLQRRLCQRRAVLGALTLVAEQEAELERFAEANVWSSEAAERASEKEREQQLPAAPLSF